MKRMINAVGGLNCGNVRGTFRLSAAVVVATAITLPAQTLTTLHSFTAADNARPHAGLVQATNGNFYGTTEFGGAGGGYEPRGNGTVFEVSPRGTLTTLYRFCSQGTYPNACSDGYYPVADLIQATNGDLYGTTSQGGANGSVGGTVFKINPTGKLTTIYSFCSKLISFGGFQVCADGDRPAAALIQATDGDLYGTTQNGGAYNYGDGTIFKITPRGELTTLYSFCAQTNCPDGAAPEAGLVQAADGDFYGTTNSGGASGQGTVFRITPSGRLTTLYSFCSQMIAGLCTDGQYPEAPLAKAAGGDFYGTTFYGGSNGNYGTVFKITPDGLLTTLYSFCSETNCTDGANPVTGLVLAANGELYGTTPNYGSNGQGGTIFEITPNGSLTTLYSFCSQGTYPACTDGENPEARLIQAANGDFYGTTFEGGASQSCPQFAYGCGTIFSLSVGAPVALLGN